MSIRFKKFITRVGIACEFKPIKNQLLNYLEKESENKYKNYPRLLELMKNYWTEYRSRFRISHLLKDHHQEIFYFYLTTIFPFRKRGLKFENPEAPTPVDFKLVYRYHFNIKEIEAVKEIIKKLNIKGNTEGILKRILIFAISSFGPMVEQIFERPFAFQFSSIDSNQLNNGEYEVIAIISAREQ
ncbi:MAG: hypothetical protein ACTSUT_20135 [Promethearchaeota archaeon]